MSGQGRLFRLSECHLADCYSLATFNAFRIPYVANFPQALLKTMGKYFKERRYNNFISIVQSSGTGKSRGVAEAAQIRFAFLFNIRRDVRYFSTPSGFLSWDGLKQRACSVSSARRQCQELPGEAGEP